MNNAIDKEQARYSIWEYTFTWPWYGSIDPPYYSAHTQAVGIVVLAHAYDLTGNQAYIDKAHKAFQALLVDYDNGAATTSEDHGKSLFFHELAKPGFEKTCILNGQTGSLFNIWQYYQLTNDPQAKIIFDKGINYLKHHYESMMLEAGRFMIRRPLITGRKKTSLQGFHYTVHV